MADAAETHAPMQPPPLARAGAGTALWPILISAALVGLIAIGALGLEASMSERLLVLNRYLARLSFLLFISIYIARPAFHWFQNQWTRNWLKLRRSLGLSYALVMAAHLCAILGYQMQPDTDSIELLTLVVGGLGFILIGALAATSSDGAVRRLGIKNWKRLHGATIQLLWVIYAFTYLGRVEETGAVYLPGLIGVFALLAFRLSTRLGPGRKPGFGS